MIESIFIKKIGFVVVGLLLSFQMLAQQHTQNPIPTKQQLAWHNMEFYLFVHFGPNTFTEQEWGHGTESTNEFNPTGLNCLQWCNVAKATGAKGIIITAKHHDGFCLWPSKFSKHTVAYSKWENGKGDVLKELSNACKQIGLKFGVYLSPWDRNHPLYGTPAYNDMYIGMMKEILSNYGTIWELWWDGANGEGPNGKKQLYDWEQFKETVKKISPKTLVFSDIGPHIRWVGNEDGLAGKTNWNLLDTTGFTPGIGAPKQAVLNTGNKFGKAWIPAECDVSIRNGWFYHPKEDSTVKTAKQLFQLYLKSVGRGANLLLNVPANKEGLFSTIDATTLVQFYELKEKAFANNLLMHAITRKVKNITVQPTTVYSQTIVMSTAATINCLVLQEDIRKGQQIALMQIILHQKNGNKKTIDITTVGHKRIVTFNTVTNVESIELVIKESKRKPLLASVKAYLLADDLLEQ